MTCDIHKKKRTLAQRLKTALKSSKVKNNQSKAKAQIRNDLNNSAKGKFRKGY